ncbi:MAG TPA: STAS domain-containing protein [Blastocatellia bacterium]
MLRIAEEKGTDGSTILQLDGRIAGPWVEVLRASCERISQENSRVVLDLLGVSFADHIGVRFLQQLDQQQIALINCSPFLQEQMKLSMTE